MLGYQNREPRRQRSRFFQMVRNYKYLAFSCLVQAPTSSRFLRFVNGKYRSAFHMPPLQDLSLVSNALALFSFLLIKNHRRRQNVEEIRISATRQSPALIELALAKFSLA